MSKMKDLDYRVRIFGECLFDEQIEEYETQLIECEREGKYNRIQKCETMVALLKEFKQKWSNDRIMSVCLAKAFKEWLRGEEATVLAVLESDDVDFEVLGYMTIWVELYLGGSNDEI